MYLSIFLLLLLPQGSFEVVTKQQLIYSKLSEQSTMMVRRGAPRKEAMFLAILVCAWPVSIFGAPSLPPPQELEAGSDGEAGPSELVCPPCDILFTKLEPTGDGGKLVQDVKVQERGEPKSGTGFMFFWAGGTLVQTCRYLQMMYGAWWGRC